MIIPGWLGRPLESASRPAAASKVLAAAGVETIGCWKALVPLRIFRKFEDNNKA